MAQLVPFDALTTQQAAAMGHFQEAQVLQALADDLSDEFTIFHGVHWSNVGHRHSAFGEIDFIIMDRMANLLAIEHKANQVFIQGNDLVAHYGGTSKSVADQLLRNLTALRKNFDRRVGGSLPLDYLLYLPNSVVDGPLPASLDIDRVLDARSQGTLADWVRNHFYDREQGTDPLQPQRRAAIHSFFAQEVRAVPSIGHIGRQARELVSQMSGGLATWAARLELHPHRLHILGTAGSGKTQHALAELRAAEARRVPSLYVCFNAPLAHAMRQEVLNEGLQRVQVATAHELGRRIWEAVHGRPMEVRANDSDAFGAMIDALCSHASAMQSTFHTIVVDEAQDLDPSWLEAILAMADESTRVTVLEDPCQLLYDRPPVQLPGWARLHCPVNVRSPRILVEYMNELGLTDEPISAGSPVDGFDPTIVVAASDSLEDFREATSEAVRSLLQEGYSPQHMAVLTDRGMAKSCLLPAETGPKKLGGLQLRRHIGFGPDGAPIYSDGELSIETVHRFKGQSADAVVLTEIAWQTMGERERRKLFVGMSRARLRLVLVATEDAAQSLCL